MPDNTTAFTKTKGIPDLVEFSAHRARIDFGSLNRVLSCPYLEAFVIQDVRLISIHAKHRSGELQRAHDTTTDAGTGSECTSPLPQAKDYSADRSNYWKILRMLKSQAEVRKAINQDDRTLDSNKSGSIFYLPGLSHYLPDDSTL